MKLIFRFALFTAIALGLGLGSAWMALSQGIPGVVAHSGPWRTWLAAGRENADPYTVARTARAGLLPLSSAGAIEFTATNDSAGRSLRPSCRYDVRIPPMQALWWSLALTGNDDSPIASASNRHAFSSDNASASADGLTHITLSGEAAPGYWLPSGNNGTLRLTLRLLRPLGAARDGVMPAEALPAIERLGC